MAQIEIPYGEEKIQFEIPDKNLLLVGWPKQVSTTLNLEDKINKILDEPIGMDPIEKKADSSKKVAIICDDYTRPTPAHRILPILLERLKKAGVKAEDICIIIAAGIHRPMEKEEIQKKVGKQIVSEGKIRIIQHDADDKNHLKYVGKTKFGTPLWINRAVVDSDIKIGIGSLEAHAYSGFCGGSKILLPGVAGKESIFHNHGELARSPQSWFGRTNNNPCWMDMVEAANIAGLDMVINVILDSKLEIMEAVAGNPVKAQEEGIKFFLKVFGVQFPERADIVIASANPKHWYFDMSNVPMMSTAEVVKNGGVRIIAAYCSEELGPPLTRRLYEESLSRLWPSAEVYLEEIKAGKYSYEMANAPAIYKILQAQQKSDMIIVTEGVSAEKADQLHLNWTRSMQEALKRAFKKCGEKAKVGVMPLGGTSLPYVKGQENNYEI